MRVKILPFGCVVVVVEADFFFDRSHLEVPADVIVWHIARLSTHPNDQILTLMEIPGNRRLRRHVPNDLPDRFLV
jgi:hypothetical protein